MKRKHSVTWHLLLLVLIPVLLISVLGIRALNHEQAARSLEQQALIQQQLTQLTQNINLELRQSRLQWQNRILATKGDSDRLRDLVLLREGVDLILVFTPSGEQEFPPEKSVSALFVEKRLLLRHQAQIAGLVKRLQTSHQEQVSSVNTESGSGLMNCWQDKKIFCTLYSAQWLEQQLQRSLSDTLQSPLNESLELAELSVTRQTVTPSFLYYPLTKPLDGWYLGYQEPRHNLSQNALYPAYLAVLSPIVLLVCGLGVQLYLKHQQQARSLQQRTIFTAQLAHEFRTPLTNLRLYSDLIRQASETDERQQYCDVLDMESQRLNRLVDNAILLFQPDQPMVASQINMSPDELIKEALRAFQPALALENIRVSLQLDTPVMAGFNQLALQCTLNNLLDNVCKYAPDSHVSIQSSYRYAAQSKQASIHGQEKEQQQGQIQLHFSDTGTGISKALTQDLFKPYQNSNNREKGFGLGLSVCHKLLKNAGGDIAYHTENGAYFTVTLPCTVIVDKPERQVHLEATDANTVSG